LEAGPVKGIDLHIHTRHSDGELAPGDVVAKARGMDLGAIAITDHDSTDGVEEAVRAGIAAGLEVIPGVELSVEHGPYSQVHLLGYYVDGRNEMLEHHLTELRDSRIGRGKRLVEKVNDALRREGKPEVDFLRVEALARKVVGRPHIARVMCETGITSTMMEAFKQYLVPLNIDKHRLPFGRAVEVVTRAGGVPVLAHPNLITRDPREEVRLLDDFTRLGLRGLEIYYNNMTAEDTEHYRRLAEERNLLMTGGSDFHGYSSYGNLGRVHGGRLVPAALLKPLKERFFHDRVVLVVLCLPDGSGADDRAGTLAQMAGAEIEDAESIRKVNFPDRAGAEVSGAVNRILGLETELRLLRRRSAVVVSSLTRNGSCRSLSALARRTGADLAFVDFGCGRETFEGTEDPVVRYDGNPEAGEPGITGPLSSLAVILYFTGLRLGWKTTPA
jgi:predicted metal-dependent phosphoesterase TrpH